MKVHVIIMVKYPDGHYYITRSKVRIDSDDDTIMSKLIAPMQQALNDAADPRLDVRRGAWEDLNSPDEEEDE